jgi:polar amino acid transport system substrate-binding protein
MRGFKLIEDRTQGLKTENVDTIDQTFLMLNLGRVDVVVQEQSAGMQSIHRLKLSGITVLDPPLEEIPVYHYLNKKHSNLLPRITKKLLAMKKSGEIDRIQLRVVEQF